MQVISSIVGGGISLPDKKNHFILVHAIMITIHELQFGRFQNTSMGDRFV